MFDNRIKEQIMEGSLTGKMPARKLERDGKTEFCRMPLNCSIPMHSSKTEITYIILYCST
jgi:hypothetical protein